MLDECLAGHTRIEGDHYWRITFKGKTFANFPKGEHGKKENAEIQVGWIRQVARYFDITKCAKAHSGILR